MGISSFKSNVHYDDYLEEKILKDHGKSVNKHQLAVIMEQMEKKYAKFIVMME